ncbi:MAG TPA: ribonuclease III [Patescibacteria group bacterium]|nr:ribonuclease III [Patescibacteria group bacterium]
MRDLKEFESKIEIKFDNKNLLKNVFIHRSFLNENPKLTLESNERLEFLGDAVLELVVTENMFKNYQNPEGELTGWRSALVCGPSLSKVAIKFEMGKFLYLSRGEEKMGGREKDLLLANAFEALIGALYLEKGYEKVKKFLEKHLLSDLPEIIEKKIYIDPKTQLQEKAQDELGVTPTYEVLKETGPDHAKIFTMTVFLGNKEAGLGQGSSKQLAQVKAAQNAIDKWPKESKK